MAQRPRSDSWLGHSLAALLLVLALPSLAFGVERERHNVVVDGHALAVWSKLPEHPHAVMLLVHGRTWSARPDFDLQVPGETLSLMDGLVAMNIATYAVDLRGYGESARDGSGWLTPGRAAADAVPPPGVAGLAQDAAVVPAARQHEGQIAVGEELHLVDRVPGRDVVLLGSDHEERRGDVLERDHPPVNREAAGG